MLGAEMARQVQATLDAMSAARRPSPLVEE
jgi:hypothetical protein